jgi:hypothetical protein
MFPIRISLLLLAAFAAPLTLHAQTTAPASRQKPLVAVQQQRVDMLRDEIKETDARIESRLDGIIDALKMITDSKDSQTKVARMKEDTGKKLMKTINYYDQKRAAIREELRMPRLHLTEEEKRGIVATFDARIDKRTQQILALNKSMPAHKDYDRYKTTGNYWGTTQHRNEDYEQNRRMTSHDNKQRDAIVKQLDAGIARLDRQSRTLRTQLAATTDPQQRAAVSGELKKTDDLIAERRRQRLDTLKPSGSPAHTVTMDEAVDLDHALQGTIEDLQRDFTTLFGRYNTLINELSSLHATEANHASKAAN